MQAQMAVGEAVEDEEEDGTVEVVEGVAVARFLAVDEAEDQRSQADPVNPMPLMTTTQAATIMKTIFLSLVNLVQLIRMFWLKNEVCVGSRCNEKRFLGGVDSFYYLTQANNASVLTNGKTPTSTVPSLEVLFVTLCLRTTTLLKKTEQALDWVLELWPRAKTI